MSSSNDDGSFVGGLIAAGIAFWFLSLFVITALGVVAAAGLAVFIVITALVSYIKSARKLAVKSPVAAISHLLAPLGAILGAVLARRMIDVTGFEELPNYFMSVFIWQDDEPGLGKSLLGIVLLLILMAAIYLGWIASGMASFRISATASSLNLIPLILAPLPWLAWGFILGWAWNYPAQ